jgi:hypothetical protein
VDFASSGDTGGANRQNSFSWRGLIQGPFFLRPRVVRSPLRNNLVRSPADLLLCALISPCVIKTD